MPHYRILRERFRHSGERKTNGDIIELAFKAAEPLLVVGAVELVADDDVIIIGGGAAPMFDGLLGSPSLPLVTDLPNGDKLLAADLVRKAFEASQLSAEEWNALPQEDRDGALVDQLDEILYGLQLRELQLEDQQNNNDSGDEHAPPREIATQTQPSDDQGRVEGLNTGDGGGASASLPESNVNSEAQGSGPQAEGDASANPPAGDSTAADAGTEFKVSDELKDEASGQPANLDAGAAAAAAPAPKSKAKPTKQSKKK